jgi:adenosylcobinamide-GDP ribazoletransferase
VLRTPDVGAFGVAVAGATLLLRWAALASLAPAPLLLAGLWCASRTAMAVIALTVPYARAGDGGGLASAFLPPAGRGAARRIAAGGTLAALVAAVLWRPLAGAAAVAAALAAAWLVARFARRRIGGFTGDVLGAAGLLAETAGLVVAAARWRG